MKARIIPQKQTKVSVSTNGTIENTATISSTTTKPEISSSNVIDGIATLKSSDVRVKEIKASGAVVLAAKVSIDLEEAIRNNINNVKLSIAPPARDASSISSKIQTAESAVNNILNASTLMKSNAQKKNESILKSVNIDITSAANNENAGLIGKTKNFSQETEVTLKTVPALSLDSLSEYPILQTPTQNENINIKKETSLKQLLMDTALKDSLPISFSSKENIPFSSTEESLNGLTRSKRFFNNSKKELRSSNASTSPDEIRQTSIVGKFLDGKTKDKMTAADVSNNSSDKSSTSGIPVITKEVPGRKTIEKEIILSSEDLDAMGSNLNFIVESVGSDGVKSKPAGCKVDISEKISKFNFSEKVGTQESRSGNTFSPPEPRSTKKATDVSTTPRGTLEQRSQTVSPKLKEEEDKKINFGFESPSQAAGAGKAQDVVIYEKDINPFLPPEAAAWKEITTSAVDNKKEINQTTATTGTPRLTRHVNFGFSPSPPTFVEAMIPSATRHLAMTNSLMGNVVAEVDNRFISLTAFLVPAGIQIRLSGFQSSYIVGVWRRDASIHEKNFSCIDTENSLIKVDETTAEAVFIDTAVKEDHVYEYRSKIFTREGRSIFGSTMTRITFRYTNNSDATIKLTKPDILIDESGRVDVKFSITADLTDTNVSTLVDILKSQGNDHYFTDDLTENRMKLKNIIAYQVVRHDLTMGNVESFPLFKGGIFSDVEQSSKSSVTSLQTNHAYRYVISLFSRAAEELIPTITRTVSSNKNTPFALTSALYNIRPSKSLHPTTLRKSILRNEKTIAKANLETEFLAGFTGMQAFTEVSITAAKPKIINGSCTRTSSGSCELRWSVTGQIDKFDHFVIAAEQLGMMAIIGKSHAFSHNNSYIFEDKTLSMTIGDVSYFVIPIYIDFSAGEKFKLGNLTSTN